MRPHPPKKKKADATFRRVWLMYQNIGYYFITFSTSINKKRNIYIKG